MNAILAKRVYPTFLLFASLLFLASCLSGSVNPYYTKATVVKMPELNGMWCSIEKDREGKEKRAYMEIQGKKFYSHNDDGSKDTADIVFFKVADTLFADIQVDKDKGDRERPPHLLFKLNFEKDQLTFTPLDYEWLEQKSAAEEIKIPFKKEENKSSVLFTAKPKQWVEFIRAYKDDPTAFVEKDGFVLRIDKAQE